MAIERAQRVLWGRIGGLTLRARHDPQAYTARARETFLASFERQVDPDRTLPQAEREARALALRKAHFARLASRSAEVRRRRKPPGTK